LTFVAAGTGSTGSYGQGAHQVRLRCRDGAAMAYWGLADAVITHPYGHCPKGLPSIVSIVGTGRRRRGQVEDWVGSELTEIGCWGRVARNCVFVANLPYRHVELGDLVEDGEDRGCGFMPIELPRRILQAYSDFIRPGMTVWDGYCGRATIGKACIEAGINYIGIDIDPERIRMAREYLGEHLDHGAVV
jgi:hypothetical protein